MELTCEHLRVIIYFLLLKQLNVTKCKNEMDSVLGIRSPSYSAISKRFGQFRRGRKSLNDDPRSGRPPTAVTDENTQAVKQMIEVDPYITYRQIAVSVSIGTRAVYKIVNEQLHYRKLFSRFVPHSLTEKQKDDRVNWCNKMLKYYKSGKSRRVSDIITGDESWMHFFEPLLKQQSRAFVEIGETAFKKVRKVQSSLKRMFVFSLVNPVLLTT